MSLCYDVLLHIGCWLEKSQLMYRLVGMGYTTVIQWDPWTGYKCIKPAVTHTGACWIVLRRWPEKMAYNHPWLIELLKELFMILISTMNHALWPFVTNVLPILPWWVKITTICWQGLTTIHHVEHSHYEPLLAITSNHHVLPLLTSTTHQ